MMETSKISFNHSASTLQQAILIDGVPMSEFHPRGGRRWTMKAFTVLMDDEGEKFSISDLTESVAHSEEDYLDKLHVAIEVGIQMKEFSGDYYESMKKQLKRVSSITGTTSEQFELVMHIVSVQFPEGQMVLRDTCAMIICGTLLHVMSKDTLREKVKAFFSNIKFRRETDMFKRPIPSKMKGVQIHKM